MVCIFCPSWGNGCEVGRIGYTEREGWRERERERDRERLPASVQWKIRRVKNNRNTMFIPPVGPSLLSAKGGLLCTDAPHFQGQMQGIWYAPHFHPRYGAAFVIDYFPTGFIHSTTAPPYRDRSEGPQGLCIQISWLNADSICLFICKTQGEKG